MSFSVLQRDLSSCQEDLQKLQETGSVWPSWAEKSTWRSLTFQMSVMALACARFVS